MELLDLPISLSDVFSAETSENLEVLNQAIGDLLASLWARVRQEQNLDTRAANQAYFVDVFSSYPDNYARFIAIQDDMLKGICPLSTEKNLIYFMALHDLPTCDAAWKYVIDLQEKEPEGWKANLREHIENAEDPLFTLGPVMNDWETFSDQAFYAGGFLQRDYASVTDWFVQTFQINTEETVGSEYSLGEILNKVFSERTSDVNISLLCNWFTKLAYSIHQVDTSDCSTILDSESLMAVVAPSITNKDTGETYTLDFSTVDSDEYYDGPDEDEEDGEEDGEEDEDGESK